MSLQQRWLGPLRPILNSLLQHLSEAHLILISAIYIVLANNWALLSTIYHLDYEGSFQGILFKLSTVVLMIVLMNLCLLLFFALNLSKTAIVIFVVLSAFADFYMREYGIVMDRTTLQSVFETTFTESSEFLNFNLLFSLIFCAFLYSAFIFFLEVPKIRFQERIIYFIKSLSLTALVIAILGVSFYKEYASFFRNTRQVRHMYNPINTLYGSFRHVESTYFPKQTFFVKIAEDTTHSSKNRKRFVILVLGETARADHFSLNGYPHKTNPLLAQQKVISFDNVTSCGTATATSVPCIFSHLAQTDFHSDEAENYENLLDITQKAGYKTIWIDNNTGCKGVCKRVINIDLTQFRNPALCKSSCYDEILLKALAKIPTDGKEDQLVVLHMLGSHGPTYFLRFPENFAAFKPGCDTNHLVHCSKEQVINTYDNTLLYTDFVLAGTINYLKTLNKNYDTAMMYISDHGESLGENGIYLHSLPYNFAPKEQKHVPLILWLSDSLVQNSQVSPQHLEFSKRCAWSHDNIFHSMLGLLNIKTKIYNNQLDIFNSRKKCD